MANEAQTTINRAAALLLRPLIRTLINFGIPLSDFIETVKQVYVSVAREQLELTDTRVTDSRISVMTGVHRSDVKRIEEECSGSRPPLVVPTLLQSVMQLWGGDVRFITKAGKPRNLKRRRIGAQTPPDEASTFEDLIEAVTKGTQPRALLDEWVRLGAVSINARGDVCYYKLDFATGQVQQLIRMMIASSDRFEAALAQQAKPSNEDTFAFSIRASHIRASDMPALIAYAKKLSRQVADRINVRAAQIEERGRKSGGAERFSFGVHVYHEPMVRLEKYGFPLW
jgi:Family of unknown function (DUF6502)